MKKNYFYIILLLAVSFAGNLSAQIPQIEKVELLNTYPADHIIISGSGFSSNAAQLQVWFDQVKGTIITSSDYAIEVAVPAQARLSNIEVINLSSKLSAKSPLKFMPSYNGDTFDPSKFTSALSFTSTQEFWDLTSVDLNDDAKPEIICTKFFSPATDLMILQNESTPGNLSFTKLDKTNLSVLDLSFPTDNIVCGDLNGDGKPELVATRSGSPRNSVHILTNTSSGSISFASAIALTLDVGDLATRSSIKDLNGDGKPEIITTNTNSNTLYIFENQSSGGTLTFNDIPIKVIVTGASNTYSVDAQDLNNDGLPDIIVNQFQTNDIFLLKNQSSTTINFPSVQKVSLNGTLNRITTADLNKDGLLDIITTNTVSNQIAILFNKSTSSGFSFPSNQTIGTSVGPWGVDVSDFDGDGDPDIIVANRNQQTVNVLLHNGNFTTPVFTKQDVNTAKPTRNVIAGDLDGDGKPDLAFTSFNTSTNSYSLDILRNKNCHQPKILNTGPLVICSGQTIRLNAIPAINISKFEWKDGSTSVGTNTNYLDITTPGTYAVKATGETNACALTSASVNVTSDPGAPPSDPDISSNSPICSNSTLQLNTTVTGVTYLWTGPNGFTSNQPNPAISNADINDAGLYVLQISAGACKSNTKSTRVDVVNLAALNVSTTVPSNVICQGNNLELSVTNDPSYQYQWVKDGSDISLQTSNTLTVTQGGSYQVRVDNTNVNCSRTTPAVTVTVVTVPVSSFNINPASACIGDLLAFENNSTVNNAATPVYNWNFGDANTSNTASPAHSYASASTFSVSLQVGYSGVTGCTNTSNKSIVINSKTTPTIQTTAASICPQESATLSIPDTYTQTSWSTQETGNSIDISTPATYSVTAKDANGCDVSSDIAITAKPVPAITVTSDVSSISTGNKAQLQASGADTYAWLPAETLSDASVANPIASPTETTTYTVTGTVTDGCSGSNQITITVDGSKINIKVPPAFSPNGDGGNDFLVIDGSNDYPNCTLNIFDGRGRRVYQANGSDNWDGTYQGKQVPEGTYYYVFSCPDTKPVTGSILVFR